MTSVATKIDYVNGWTVRRRSGLRAKWRVIFTGSEQASRTQYRNNMDIRRGALQLVSPKGFVCGAVHVAAKWRGKETTIDAIGRHVLTLEASVP